MNDFISKCSISIVERKTKRYQDLETGEPFIMDGKPYLKATDDKNEFTYKAIGVGHSDHRDVSGTCVVELVEEVIFKPFN